MEGFWSVLLADLHRYAGRRSAREFVRRYLFTAGFTYTVWFRTAHWFAVRAGPLNRVLYVIAWAMLRRHSRRFGIQIPPRTTIGPGLLISHFGSIVLNEDVVIGRNCNLSHDVTIGRSYRGAREGCPRIGDHVYIAPGAKIFGSVTIGDFAAIGANCVVTKDVVARGVVVGIPGRVVSTDGSDGYVVNVSREAVRIPPP